MEIVYLIWENTWESYKIKMPQSLEVDKV